MALYGYITLESTEERDREEINAIFAAVSSRSVSTATTARRRYNASA